MSKAVENPSGVPANDAPHTDLRDWLERVEAIGELQTITGVDWDLEMGAVAEMIYHARPENPPAL